MKVFYYQQTDSGSEPKFVDQVTKQNAINHIELYRKTELYGELHRNNFGPQIAIGSEPGRTLSIDYEEDSTYGISIGYLGSLQSGGYSIDEVESFIEQYFSLSHVEFFYKQVHSGKHYYFVPKGIKSLYCSILEWWYK